MYYQCAPDTLCTAQFVVQLPYQPLKANCHETLQIGEQISNMRSNGHVYACNVCVCVCVCVCII
jgi:hypothetical protein